jgi:hypothetical protein
MWEVESVLDSSRGYTPSKAQFDCSADGAYRRLLAHCLA